MITEPIPESDQIDLWSLGYMFAIQNVDPRIGFIEVLQTNKFHQGQTSGRIKTPIQMVECSMLQEGGLYADELNNPKFNITKLYKNSRDENVSWLCPVGLQNLTLQG